MRIQQYPLISDQVSYAEVRIIITQLEQLINAGTEGDIVEFGCYEGTTSLFIGRLLMETRANKTFHVYDSFEGLPAKTRQDASPAGEQFKAGELHASKARFIKNFRQAHVPLPIIHKGWFGNLTPADVPPKICFAFLDGDFYESIRDSLNLITPNLAQGATIIVDDYQAEALPGAARAVDEWLKQHPAHTLQIASSLAIIKS